MRKKLLTGMAVLSLAGCATGFSEAPRPTNFSILTQQKIQAASHWQVIANDVAAQIRSSVNKDELLYIAQPVQSTEFSRAFRDQLITALVNGGAQVSKANDTRALVIDVDTQLVRFSPQRFQNGRFVSATAIAAGLLAVNGMHLSSAANVAIGTLGLTAAYDWNNWAEREFAQGFTPQNELIVTTSATNYARYITRRTDVYFIADSDRRLYRQDDLRSVRVTGGA